VEELKPKLSSPTNPTLSATWLRFPNSPFADLNRQLSRPLAHTVVGGKEGGKSALCETIAFLGASQKNGGSIIDLYGARDNEGLGWLRSPFKDSVLLLKGEHTQVNCPTAPCKNIGEVTLDDLEDYRVIVSCARFYRSIREEWYSVGKFLDFLWTRESWTKLCWLVVREANSIISSRMMLGEDQAQAVKYFVKAMQEMRHSGLSIAVDTLRWMGAEINYRTISDYIYLKAPGIDGLPQQLDFLYSYFDPFQIMQMPAEQFIVLSRRGALGVGRFDCPYWHKNEHENLRKLFAIDLKHDKDETKDLTKDTGLHVNDNTHAGIIRDRFEKKTKKGKVLSMGAIAFSLGRSSKTIHDQICYHNDAVTGVGECPRCKRVNGKYAKQEV